MNEKATTTKQLNIRLTEDQLYQLRIMARRRDRNVTQMIILALQHVDPEFPDTPRKVGERNEPGRNRPVPSLE